VLIYDTAARKSRRRTGKTRGALRGAPASLRAVPDPATRAPAARSRVDFVAAKR
jgi:hypothetical protein